MSRFSPQVTPNSGAALAQALGQGVSSYLGARRQRQQDAEDLYAKGLRPESDDERGVREGRIAAPVPTTSTTNANLAAALSAAIGAKAPNVAPPPDVFANALGGDQQIGNDHYRFTDQKQMSLGQARALQMLDMAQKSATIHKDYREADQLRPGDPGYVANEGAVAGARAGATAGIDVQKAFDIARRTAPIDIEKAGGISRAQLPAKMAEMQATKSAELSNERQLIPLRAENAAPVAAVDPKDGTTRFYTRSDALGLNKAPAAGAAGGERSGMAAAFLSRLKMGKADFDNGMQFIRDYHGKLATGAESITPAMMAESAAASTGPNPDAHGALAGLSNAGTAFMQGHANSKLATEHSDYQRYVNLLNSMSLAMTEVLPRPTSQILGIEKGINTAKTGDTPERLSDIQHRLDKAYEYLFSNPEGMLQRGPAGGSQVPAKVPSYEDWKKANGHP